MSTYFMDEDRLLSGELNYSNAYDDRTDGTVGYIQRSGELFFAFSNTMPIDSYGHPTLTPRPMGLESARLAFSRFVTNYMALLDRLSNAKLPGKIIVRLAEESIGLEAL